MGFWKEILLFHFSNVFFSIKPHKLKVIRSHLVWGETSWGNCPFRISCCLFKLYLKARVPYLFLGLDQRSWSRFSDLRESWTFYRKNTIWICFIEQAHRQRSLSSSESGLTWWGYHSLPFLEQACLETVPRTEVVGLVPWHELLHGLQDDTQLQTQRDKQQRSVRADLFDDRRASCPRLQPLIKVKQNNIHKNAPFVAQLITCRPTLSD